MIYPIFWQALADDSADQTLIQEASTLLSASN
jgi:hypothetical protein